MDKKNGMKQGSRLLVLVGLAVLTLMWAAQAGELAAKQVAPGVWRVRLGAPEELTPLHFRFSPVQLAGFKGLPADEQVPLDLKTISQSTSGRSFALTLPLEQNEQVYGFGLSPNLFNMTGKRVNLRPTDNPENDRGESHAPVPLYVSSRGYGVYVDTARYTQFFCGIPAPVDPDAALAEREPAQTKTAPPVQAVTVLIGAAQGVDVYLFNGPTLGEAVRRYNLFAGGGAVPPLWGLGLWYRGASKFSAQASQALAASFREQHMPCDVWGIEPGWQTKSYSCSFVWQTNAFPNPDAFISQMHALGYRLNFWEHAFTHSTAPMFALLKPWSGDQLVWQGLVPDFATSQARKIFLAHHEAVLFAKGADGLKLDECDHQPYATNRWSFSDTAVFPSGLNGAQMHSLFGVLYQQTMLEPLRQRNLRAWGLVRNSQALAAALPYGVYSDSYDHRGYVRGLLNAGFSGLLWVPELRDCASVEDLYRRVETLIFAPVAQINCWYLKNPPWLQIETKKNNAGELMANRQEVSAVIRRLFELRMSLIPYLYAAFNQYRLTGTPPIRALVMDWPQDPQTHRIDDQFMFGPALLVAPMFAGQIQRQVYLPAGNWFDFWTHEKIAGGRTLEVTQSQERIPIFVRDNSLLPLARPVEYVKNDTCFELAIDAFGDHPDSFTLFEDDGISLDFEQGKQNRIELIWKNGHGESKKSGMYRGPDRYRIVAWLGG